MSSDKESSVSEIEISLVKKLKTIIDGLNEENWEQKYDVELDTVDECHNHLTVRYYQVSKFTAVSLSSLLTCLLLIDILMNFSSLLYGLTVNIWASMYFIYPKFRGKRMIAGVSEGVSREAIRDMEINKMVFNNMGFVLLILGFVLQILSHQVLDNNEFISMNLLSNILPNWSAVIMIFFAFMIAMKSIDLI